MSNSNDLLPDPFVSVIAIGTGISSCLSISREEGFDRYRTQSIKSGTRKKKYQNPYSQLDE
jgi:hypothetical protein